MEKYLEYISTAALKFLIIHKDTEEVDLKIIFANKSVESILDVPVNALINKNMTDVFPNLNKSVFNWTKIISEAAMTNESKIIEQYFDVFEKHLKLNVFGYNDHDDSFFAVISDQTEKKEIKREILGRDIQIKHLENELKERSNLDPITKLHNFQYIIHCLKNSIDSYNDEGEKFCLMMLDIDNFSEINFNFGFKLGDTVLQNVAFLISTIIRKIDVAARIGSDKFLIIFNNMDYEIAKIMIDKIKQEIKKRSIKLDDTVISVSGSLLEYNGESIEELMNESEMKLSKAKTMGKGIIIS
ncbi:MAG: diguanylate cyclase/phosphodiesterase [Bacillota bacterium]|jgi:diguanylate cyclase (GGDEF)-like protein|nr:diguanylate cyclase/phosphodiesterase [Bacillota bacterium]